MRFSDPCVVRNVPWLPVPFTFDSGGSSSYEIFPLQSSSPTFGRPICRSDQLPRFFSLQRHPLSQPHKRRVVQHSPRFRSQVFSTSQRLHSQPKIRSLVSCCSRSWDSPFRVFPSQKSRTPLEATNSLAVIHWCAERQPLDTYSRQFPRRPRFHAVA